MSGPDAEARELTEREARRALREQFGLPPDFQDTSPGWEIEPQSKPHYAPPSPHLKASHERT